MDETRNLVQLRGAAAGEPAFSHENHGQQFYRFSFSVQRLSGQADVLHVIATGDQLRGLLPLEGRRLRWRASCGPSTTSRAAAASW